MKYINNNIVQKTEKNANHNISEGCIKFISFGKKINIKELLILNLSIYFLIMILFHKL